MCPLAAAVTLRGITVQYIEVAVAVIPTAQRVGEYVDFYGRVYIDGTPASRGTYVEIYVETPGGLIRIADAYVEDGGLFGSAWPREYIPPGIDFPVTPCYWQVEDTIGGTKLPCATWSIVAISLGTRNVGIPTLTVQYPVRIIQLTAPGTVGQNEPFTFSGVLQRLDAGTWKPVSGQTVTLSYRVPNQTPIIFGNVVTDTNGYFEKTDCILPNTGDYTLIAEFKGAPSLAPAVAAVGAMVGAAEIAFIGLPIAIGTILTLIGK